MLSILNIRNINYNLKGNDIYIGAKYDIKNLEEGFIVPPKGYDGDQFYIYLKNNYKMEHNLYYDEINTLIELYTSDYNYNLVCWDVRLGKAITRLLDEILEEKSYLTEYGSEGLDIYLNLDDWLAENNINNITDCQYKGLKEYLKFINSSERCLLLTGGGGVGKSWLMGLMIKIINSEAIILSPKHKIKKLHNDKYCIANMTYQSFFGIRPNYKRVNQDTGKIPYEIVNLSRSEEKIAQYTERCKVIFFDECSMIEESVYNIILELLPPYIKIVFVGDDAQIRPIGEKTSKCISETSCKIELNTVVRYSGDLLEFCRKIRNEILANSYKFSFHKKANDNSMVKSINSSIKAIDVFEKSFTDGKDIRILTFTNDSMEHYNKVINEIIFEEEFKNGNEYFVNQKLIYNAKSEYYRPNSRLVLKTTKTSKYYIQESLLDKFDEITVTNIDYCSDTLLSELNHKEDVINYNFPEFVDCFNLKLDIDDVGGFNYVIDNILEKKFYWNFITGISEIGKEVELRAIAVESYEQYFKLLETFKSKRLWMLYNFTLSMNDWVQPALSLTIDQSQGSTYQEIILDTSGICNRENINRYYVGISRAKERLYIL